MHWLKLFFILLPFCACASTHHPEIFLQSIKGSRHEGARIVDHFCSNCHADKPLIQLGAPRPFHGEDWRSRVQKGWKPLWTHTAEGMNAMPPRGGCFECSDQQLYLAIMAMLPVDLRKSLLKEQKQYNKIK